MTNDPAYAKKWRYDRDRGIRRLVDSVPARLHIATCLGAGMSLRSIAATADLSVQAVAAIRRGQPSCKRQTSAAIMSVAPGVSAAHSRDTTESFVPKIGTVRRIQALLALGWTHEELTRRTGHRSAVVLHQQGRWVTTSTHDSFDTTYRELCNRQGPSSRTRTRAAKRGYLSPVWWDDLDHDPQPCAEEMDAEEVFEPVDEVAIERVLGGDRTVSLTTAERHEAVTMWLGRGRTCSELQRRVSWNPRRYQPQARELERAA